MNLSKRLEEQSFCSLVLRALHLEGKRENEIELRVRVQCITLHKSPWRDG